MALKLQGKHALADFLNDTFALVPKIWKGALPVSLVAFLPGTALWIAAIDSLVRMLNSVIADGEIFSERPSLIVSAMAPFIWLCVLASFALYLGGSFQKAFVCAEVGNAIEGRESTFLDLLRGTARRAFVRVAVQDVVIESLSSTLTFGIIGISFLPFLFAILGRLLDSGKLEESQIGTIVLLVAIYLASILVAAAAAAWWIRVKTAVSAPATVLERVNSLSGMGRSLDLVRGRSWRIFGAMFIVSLVISFGLGILTGPVTFTVILPGYFTFLKESISGNSPSPESIAAFLSSMSWAMGISILISGVVQGCLWPSFLTLLHADLRIRSGEKEPMVEPEPAQAALPPESTGVNPPEPREDGPLA